MQRWWGSVHRQQHGATGVPSFRELGISGDVDRVDGDELSGMRYSSREEAVRSEFIGALVRRARGGDEMRGNWSVRTYSGGSLNHPLLSPLPERMSPLPPRMRTLEPRLEALPERMRTLEPMLEPFRL